MWMLYKDLSWSDNFASCMRFSSRSLHSCQTQSFVFHTSLMFLCRLTIVFYKFRMLLHRTLLFSYTLVQLISISTWVSHCRNWSSPKYWLFELACVRKKFRWINRSSFRVFEFYGFLDTHDEERSLLKKTSEKIEKLHSIK